MNILRNIGNLIVFAGILSILIFVLKLNLKQILYKVTDKVFNNIGNSLLKVHNKNLQKAAISNKKTFANSKRYKQISQVIFDLGMNDVTVEGFLCALTILSVLTALILFVTLKSILLTIIGFFASFILAYTLLYMVASEGHFKREFAIMDAIDIIIVNMEGGTFKAVKEQIDLFDDSIKEDFRMFISDVYEYKIPIEEALDLLGERLGPSFKRFKEKAKEFESKGRAGMLETFTDDMNENMYRRMDLRDLLDTLREANMGFAIAMGVCGLLAFVIVGGSEYLRNLLFMTTAGRIVLAINVIAIIGSFAFLQSLRADKGGENE